MVSPLWPTLFGLSAPQRANSTGNSLRKRSAKTASHLLTQMYRACRSIARTAYYLPWRYYGRCRSNTTTRKMVWSTGVTSKTVRRPR